MGPGWYATQQGEGVVEDLAPGVVLGEGVVEDLAPGVVLVRGWDYVRDGQEQG